jgi:aldose 1-epimerase
MIQIQEDLFGTTPTGQDVALIRMTNSKGESVALMSFGATLLEVNVPDRSGHIANVNLKFDSLAPYLGSHPYFGSTVGRFCNRIEHGKFVIDGVKYQLATNNGDHHLHGGEMGLSHRLFAYRTYQTTAGAGVRFTYTSPDGEESFPGTVTVIAEYLWNNSSELTISFEATTDAATHLNLTNHSYWNLNGAGSGSIHNHLLTLEADFVLDVDDDLIPTGQLNNVAGSGLDFRKPTAIGSRIDQYPGPKGYDHCFVVRGAVAELRPAATVHDPKSGRVLEIETTQPGIQLYTGNHLTGKADSGGFGQHEAFCLETQHFPNAPNRPSFVSTLVRPGETLRESTVHRFSAK